MQTTIDLRPNSDFPLTPGLPDNFRGIILRESFALSGRTTAGEVILQNYQGNGFAIQLGIYKFFQFVRCILRPPAFVTGSILALKQDIKCRMHEVGSLVFREGQFSFLEYGEEYILAELRAHQEYHIMEVSCSAEMIEQNLPFFPDFAMQFQKAKASNTAFLLTRQKTAGDESRKLAHDILHSPFEKDQNTIAFEYKVRDYLWHLMLDSTQSQPEITLTQQEEQRIRELGERLRLNPAERLSISALAREMAMNESKLKMGFKQVYGKAIFEFTRDQRMQEAHRLLKYTDTPPKAVAALLGYELTTSFLTAFREYYGYPPGKIQKNKQ